MSYRDTEVDPIPQVPGAACLPAPPDWRRLYERTLERAEAAAARVEELKSAELAARATAGTYKALFKSARRKRLAAVEDAKEARRAAKNAFSLQAEVRCLNNLLADAGVASHRCSVIGLRREIVRLRKDVPRAAVQARKIRKLLKANWQLRVDQAAMTRLSRENAQLQRRIGTQETVIAKLRTTRAVLSKTLHGRRSEKRERPGTGRPRGQVQGAPGHGRTPRPGLEERVEEHNPAEEARTCGGCGEAPCGGRRGAVGAGRDRGEGISARDPPGALAPDVRLPHLAGGGLGAAGAAAVPQHALRNQRLVARAP